MSKARDLANAGTALTTVSATELGFVDGVTSAIQTQIDGRINSTIVDAKGDIVAATAADTVSRLAVGANDTVLTADSTTATGLKWAAPASGGLTLLSTTTLSGASVTISSISGAHKGLRLFVKGAYSSATPNSYYIRFNGDTGANYQYSTVRNIGTTLAGGNGVTATSIPIIASVNNTATALLLSDALVFIPRYTDTDVINVHSQSMCYQGGATSYTTNGIYDCTAAVTSITILQDTGTFSGGTAYLYGES